MLIKSLEQMESIVDSNDNLIWDGWTVVSLKPVKDGMMSKDGIRINNAWFLQKRYEPSKQGWDIPERLIG